jgi:hypothetical protein
MPLVLSNTVFLLKRHVGIILFHDLCFKGHSLYIDTKILLHKRIRIAGIIRGMVFFGEICLGIT